MNNLFDIGTVSYLYGSYEEYIEEYHFDIVITQKKNYFR